MIKCTYNRVITNEAYKVDRYYLDEKLVGKLCRKCGEVRLITEFVKSSRNSDGRASRCKECDRTYRATNADQINERMRAYRVENLSQIKDRHNSYYTENIERINERQRLLRTERAARSDAEIRSAQKRLRPDGLKQCRICQEVKPLSEFHTDRGRFDGLKVICGPCNNIRPKKQCESYWALQGIPEVCYICSGTYEEVEHVWCLDSGGPDVPRNTLPSCWQCNRGQGGKGTQMLFTYLWERYGAAEASAILRKVVGWGVWPFDQPYVAEDWT